MTLDDLLDYYHTYVRISQILNVGISSPNYWKRKGYIPYRTQLLIQHRSDGRFIASEEDGNPKKWK